MRPPRRLLRKRPRQLLALHKVPIRAAQEPLAERHIRLDFPSLTRQAVPLHTHQWVVQAAQRGMLVQESAFVLRWRVTEVRGALDGVTCKGVLGEERVGRCRGGREDEVGRDEDVGDELAGEKHSVDVRRLGKVDGSGL